MDMGLVRMVENCLRELRRNEIYAFAVPCHEISRHHSHATDAHGANSLASYAVRKQFL